MLALAYFYKEDYVMAAGYAAKALSFDTSNETLKMKYDYYLEHISK
jgi:hypothetical protein